MGKRSRIKRLCKGAHCPKSILLAVAEWIGGGDDDETCSWDMSDESANINITAIFDMWQEWKKGILPRAGGWFDQPLNLIQQIKAIELVFITYAEKKKSTCDWTKFTATQIEIIRWLDG